MHYTQYTTVSLVHMLLTILSYYPCRMLFMCMYVHTYVCASMQACQTASLCILSSVSVLLQACQDGGEPNVFGIASVDSAQFGDVTASGWTFTMSYTNANKASHVTYKLAASGGTQLSFISESPTNTYVSCCLSFS